jgi:hypothetical protein
MYQKKYFPDIILLVLLNSAPCFFILKFVKKCEKQFSFNEKELMIVRVVDEGLIDERAVLLSRLGQHDLVLREYVHKLYDFKLAEEYCNKHYNPEKVHVTTFC